MLDNNSPIIRAIGDSYRPKKPDALVTEVFICYVQLLGAVIRGSCTVEWTGDDAELLQK